MHTGCASLKPPNGVMLMAMAIANSKKKKGKRVGIIAPGFKRIQAPVGTAEREIKGDATRKKMEVVLSRWRGTIRDGITPAAKKTVVH